MVSRRDGVFAPRKLGDVAGSTRFGQPKQEPSPTSLSLLRRSSQGRHLSKPRLFHRNAKSMPVGGPCLQDRNRPASSTSPIKDMVCSPLRIAKARWGWRWQGSESTYAAFSSRLRTREFRSRAVDFARRFRSIRLVRKSAAPTVGFTLDNRFWTNPLRGSWLTRQA